MNAIMTSRAQRVAIERADALFGKRGIAEIQVIEKATQQQIEEKGRKLRELVGESYRDVIVSADGILKMAALAGEIKRDLQDIDGALHRPREVKRQRERNEADTEMHVIRSRVKYLLDVQEVIWSALDSGDYAEAARRLLRGELVYAQLMHHVKAPLMKRFPFVEHVWPGITQLRSHILDQVRQHVVEMVEMDVHETELCLTAMVTLKAASSTELMQILLQHRKLSVLNLVTNFSVRSVPVEAFSQIGNLLQNTILHAIHLFLKNTPGAFQSVLHQSIGEDLIGFSGLLIGKLGQASEQSMWEDQLRINQEAFESVSVSAMANWIQEWLSEVAVIVKDSGAGVLLKCTDLKSLSEMETAVKGALRGASWESTVQDRLGLELDLWKIVFESAFQEKCLAIVSNAFDRAVDELTSKLHHLMTQLPEKEPEALGQIKTSAWRLHVHKLEAQSSTGRRSEASQIVQTLDSKLAQILTGALEVLKDGQSKQVDQSPTASVRPGSVRSFSLLSGTHRTILPRKTERSMELEPKIQTAWESTARRLADNLDNLLSTLPAHTEIQTVEVALLIGTVAMGLAEDCPSVSMLAGPAEEWRPEIIPRSTRSSIKPDPTASPHLSNAFRKVAFNGIQRWIDWSLCALLTAWRGNIVSLTGDEHLQEVTISHQSSESLIDQHMRFSIPSGPSEPTVQLLMDASLELQRLGTYAGQPQIVHLFQFKLEEGIRRQLQQTVLSDQDGHPTDHYVLQLLMDFRFLCDVCSAGEPTPSFETDPEMQRSLSAVPEDTVSLHDSGQRRDPAVRKAVLESQSASRALESELSSLLDPIDWATYEPHLLNAEQRCYRRMHVLFGSIGMTTQNLHANTPIKLPPGSETNCLCAASVVPRFQYLPVRAALSDRGPRSVTMVSYASLLEQEDDPSGNYSFSDLAKHASGAVAPQRPDAGSFTSLGTMFTDKAAEMSALAQQRFEQFGDYLQPSSSIFSSFAKRVGPSSSPDRSRS